MIIFPAVDILAGECVRLQKGEFSTVHKVFSSALAAAQQFEADGAEWLHVVDLDGAKNGRQGNLAVIETIARGTNLHLEVGGGIRSRETVERYLSRGIARVVLGSAALRDPALVKECAAAYGDRIAVGIDARDGFVSVEGWCEASDMEYCAFAKQMEAVGVQHLIFTDISRDGMLTGPNLEALAALQQAVSCKITASGGVRDLENIRALASMGLYGAICGKSLYSGTLSLPAALQLVEDIG